MGIFYGENTGTQSYGYSAKLAAKITRKGGSSSTGAAALLNRMAGGSQVELCGEEAEQAALSLRRVAPRLRRADRATALDIAADAQAASDAGGTWTLI